MLKLAFSPGWFSSLEIGFETVSVIVTLLLAFLSFRVYKFSKQAKYKYFGISFAALSFSFLIRIAMNINLYYHVFEKVDMGTVSHAIRTFYPYPIFSLIGLILYRFVMLMGLAGIYYIVSQSKDKDKIIFFAYFCGLIAAASTAQYFLAFQMYFLFYMTSALFLLLITWHSINNYTKLKNANTLFVAFSFAALTLSQVLFIFTVFDPEMLYVVSEIVQLVGFSTLAVVYYKMVAKT